MPFLVLFPLSAIQTKTFLPVSGSFCSSKSPQHSFRLSSLAQKPKWREKNQHNVHWSASGFWRTNSPLSNNLSSSSIVNSRTHLPCFLVQHFPGTTKFFILEDIETLTISDGAICFLESLKSSTVCTIRYSLFAVRYSRLFAIRVFQTPLRAVPVRSCSRLRASENKTP